MARTRKVHYGPTEYLCPVLPWHEEDTRESLDPREVTCKRCRSFWFGEKEAPRR